MSTENRYATAAMINKVEAGWKSRMRTQGMIPHHVKTQRAEIEYFIGAMAALDAAGFVMPPRWVVTIMSGQRICQMEPMEE